MDLPRDRIGPYRLTRRIGSGGIGEVFAAVREHEHMAQEVALKILSPESAADPQLVARFLQEARALADLQHPGVVRALHCDKLEDGTAFLAMEYLDGVTLRQWLQRRDGGVPLEAALFVAREIADAMVEVHGKGIVHRDLKPENVMLVADDRSPIGHRVKLLDFGIAKVPPAPGGAQTNTHVQTGVPALLGTAAYMAPEQCRNVADVTDRADVYALGAVLFELVTGRPPFDSDEPVELMSMHMHVQPPHLGEVAPHAPPALGALVSSMMEKDPASRPSMARCRDLLGRSWEDADRACPLPGLSPFTEAHVELFFGRQEERAALAPMLEELARGEVRWLRIEGPVGSGKTSLVQAGLLPALANRSAGGAAWRVATLRPTAAPISALAEALSSASGDRPTEDPQELETAMRADEHALAALVRRALPSDALLLLVIDQLEALFALGGAHVARFDALLFHALTAPDAPLRLVTTLRSDYVHWLGHLPRLASLDGGARRYYLRPIEERGLLQVICGMAARSGLRLSDGLPERIAREAVETDHRLPLLGHLLRSLWALGPGRVITHEDYERIGGIGGALLQQADALLADLGEDGRARAKWLLLDLVQVGRGTPDLRRSRTRAEVLTAAGEDPVAEDVLIRLTGGPTAAQASSSPTLGLLTLSSEPGAEPARQRVDLVHDTLLRQVPAIASWIDQERDLLERCADLEAAAGAWHQVGGPTEELPTGSLLAHYEGVDAEARRHGRLTPLTSERARAFLRAARKLQRRRSRRRWMLAAVLATFVIALAASAWQARQQRIRAEDNLEQARQQQRRAEDNLRSVILATRRVVSGTDWELGRVLYTLEPRKKQLQLIDDILAELPEIDRATPEVMAVIAEAKHRRSDLARLNGSLAQADGFIAEARRQIERGLARDPASYEMLDLAAMNHSKRGKIELARGRSEQARAAFAESVALLERIGGGDEDYRRMLATSLAEQAEAELALGQLAASARHADAAIELLRQNDDGYDHSQLALALRLRGLAARDGGALGAAARALEEAQSLQAPLLERAPGNVYYRWILAVVRADLAVIRRREGRLAEADELSRWAREVGEELHLGDPTHKDYALLLCQAWIDAAEVAGGRGDRGSAEAARARACGVAAGVRERDPADERFRRFPCP